MKKLFLILLLGFTFSFASANHIVGGEIEFIYLEDGFYRINLIQYFDDANEFNPGPEGTILVYFFRNSDNALMTTQLLVLAQQEVVEYTNIECAIPELQTSRIVWTADVFLDPANYNDPEGYSIIWERCCRNANIQNIVNPIGTGMKYILEIPPLMLDGQIFVNSSPVLFAPLSDYACIDQLYYIEFTGTDPDGDSLVYSLTTPLNSSSATAVPTPTPAPDINVIFNPGYSQNNMIPGSPPLKISNKGLLTVTPAETGLFVFAVEVEEYRNGVKIGQTRRDFQMLVVDGCEPPDPPVVDIDIPDDPDFDPLVDELTYTVSDAKCFDFLVENITEGETITLRAEGVNFDDELNEIFNINQIPVDEMDNQLRIEVCIPDCPPLQDEPFILDLIAGDDACPLPQLDTMRLTINVQPPPNIKPDIAVSNKSIFVEEDDVYLETLTASDADGDSLSMSLYIEGISDPAASGFSLEITNSVPGSIEGVFTWDTDCETYDFSDIQNFNVAVLVEDFDECLFADPDTLFINSSVLLPPNTDPVVTSSIAIPNQIYLDNLLEFDVTANDSDGDEVFLSLVGGNFNLDSYEIDFTPSTNTGSTTSSFSWNLPCNAGAFSDGQEFELLFIADDEDKCKLKNFDTLRAVIQVDYPENTKPEFEPIERNQVIGVNENIRIEIEAFDLDSQDEIILAFADGIRQPASASLVFEPVSGNGRVSSFLEWQPECSLLRLGETSTLQDVVFQVTDNACPVNNIDTLKITFEIVDDRERLREFLPPNIFTPNGDGINDVFQLSNNPDRSQNLPANNCDSAFEYIVINNRSGNSVFRSENRDFVWNGGQFPEGVYYYLIKYTNAEFKGYVHLMR